MSFKERWTKKFAESLTKEEREAFKLWLEFSEGKISEQAFKAKMDMKIMPSAWKNECGKNKRLRRGG